MVFTHKENHYQSQIRKYSGFNGPKDRKPWALLQAHPGGSSMGWLYRGIGGYSNQENSWRLWCSIGMSSDSHGISWEFHGIFLSIRTRSATYNTSKTWGFTSGTQLLGSTGESTWIFSGTPIPGDISQQLTKTLSG